MSDVEDGLAAVNRWEGRLARRSETGQAIYWACRVLLDTISVEDVEICPAAPEAAGAA